MKDDIIHVSGNQTVGKRFVNGVCVKDTLEELEKAYEALGKVIELLRQIE